MKISNFKRGLPPPEAWFHDNRKIHETDNCLQIIGRRNRIATWHWNSAILRELQRKLFAEHTLKYSTDTRLYHSVVTSEGCRMSEHGSRRSCPYFHSTACSDGLFPKQ